MLRRAADPLVVDLGYGAQPWTTLELAARLRTIRPDVRVVGLEIDPTRLVPARDGVHFARGGFELAGLRPILVRAFNVLRQYPEPAVADAWATVLAGLAPGGLLVEGTCDELGRRCAWVVLNRAGPRTLTLAWDPFTVERPSDLAERLPKALIHRNVPGERVHSLLTAADRAWAHTAPWPSSDHESAGGRRRTCCGNRVFRSMISAVDSATTSSVFRGRRSRPPDRRNNLCDPIHNYMARAALTSQPSPCAHKLTS